MIVFTHSQERDFIPYFGGSTILTCSGEKDGDKLERSVCILDSETSKEKEDYLRSMLEKIIEWELHQNG